MRKILFIFAAVLLSSIGLHASESFIADNVAYFITSEPDYDEPGTVKAVRVVNKDECAGSFYIPYSVYNPQNQISYKVTEIGERVFQNCTKMSQLSIGNSVIIIGAEAFKSNYGLTAVSIGYNVERIEDGAFQDCTGLTSISIPSSVTWLGSSVFSGCNKLNTVTIGSSMRTINSFAFENCSSLKTIYCYALTPPELGQDVFKNVPQDVSIYVFDIEEYKKKWPSYSANFKQIIFERYDIRYEAIAKDKVRVIAKDGGYTQSDINIPSETYFSDAYESLAFTVTEIGPRAFGDCKSLTSVTIPNSVTTIGQAAFSRCGLTSITIPNSVTQIGAWAFEFCNNLQNIDLPSSIRSIDVGTFQWAGLTSIIIPASVERIEDYAFWACPLEYVISMSETPPALGNVATFPDAKKALVYVPNINAIAAYQNSDWNKYFTNFITNAITYKSHYQLEGNQFNVGATTFGPAIISHTFSNGTGTIICNGAITQIGKDAFSNCHSLTSIDIPNSVRTIDLNAFLNCTSLTSVKVNWTDAQSIIPINSGVFEGIAKGAGPQGATLYVPVGTIDLYKQANGWKDFGNIMVNPNTITYKASAKLPGYEGSLDVGKTTFGPAIISHEFSNGTGTIICAGEITKIGKNAFYNCSALTSIEIPNSVTTIGKQAFYRCSGLTSITIPQSVTTIEEQAFEGSSTGLTSIVVAGDNPKYDSRDNCNAIIEKATNTLILGCKHTKIPNNITTIGRSAFDGCYDLKDITIPNSVTTIGRSAFWECKNLTSITIPNSVTTIGINAFCLSGLTSITIPASVKEINEHAFWDCPNLEDLLFAERTEALNIGTYAFEKCPNLKYIISMVEAPPLLADGAFKGYDKDANVIVYVPSQDAVTMYKNSDWGKYFTNFITELEYRIISSADRTAEVIKAIPVDGKVYVPAVVTLDGNLYNVAGIGNDVFNYSDKDNEDLQSISLPPTMQYIGDRAFNRCVKLTQIELPVELQAIGASAFYGCSALDSIVIPEGVQSIGKSAFMGCSKLTSISLPTGLKNIPDECFNQCPLGQEIIVPEGVETIGQTAFNGTLETRLGTKSITLPSTLKEINHGAFYYRDGLKEITCHALTPPTLTAQAFASKHFQAQQITVYVPDRDVMAKYKDDKDQWGSDLYQFKFADLMAEANKEYLRELAGSNDTAKAIANAYCDSIDNRATTTQQVQDYTNTAAMMMDKYVFPEYKVRLCNKLDSIAKTVLNAQPIADDYKQRIMDTHFRGEAENLFAEGYAKIDALKQLYALKEKCGKALRDMGKEHQDALKMANIYAGLIDGAATQEEVYQLYEEGKKRVAQTLFLKKYWKYSDGCYYLGGFIEEK